jgi:hypothetical protein
VRFVLVHSPVVGPTTWVWVADALTALGHEVDVPDLREAAGSGDPQEFVRAARRAITEETDVLVGHSGAGVLLPMVAEPGPGSMRITFVDAGVPPCLGAATPGGDFLERLRELAIDNVVPRWSRWWPDGTMELLVVDDDRRRPVEDELVEVPLAFFETSVEMPDGWCDRPAAFLLLSESYRGDAVEAMSRGWPAAERLGMHLDVVNKPTVIAKLLIALAR